MYDFHVHSILSDGALIPAEICQRYLKKGFRAIAITDHCDDSNINYVINSLNNFVRNLPENFPLAVFVGVEITHVPPTRIKGLIKLARQLGAQLVVVHGETIVEPVARGTNLAAIEAGCDILAHPGFISEEEAKLAREKGVFLEVTTRSGHCYTNGWVINAALKTGAGLVVNNDAHGPKDILDYNFMLDIARGAGPGGDIVEKIRQDTEQLATRLFSLQSKK